MKKTKQNALFLRLTENLRANLKFLREKQELSQQELAKKAGLAVATVADIEQGRKLNVTLDTIAEITTGLDYKDPLKLLRDVQENAKN